MLYCQGQRCDSEMVIVLVNCVGGADFAITLALERTGIYTLLFCEQTWRRAPMFCTRLIYLRYSWSSIVKLLLDQRRWDLPSLRSKQCAQMVPSVKPQSCKAYHPDLKIYILFPMFEFFGSGICWESTRPSRLYNIELGCIQDKPSSNSLAVVKVRRCDWKFERPWWAYEAQSENRRELLHIICIGILNQNAMLDRYTQ